MEYLTRDAPKLSRFSSFSLIFILVFFVASPSDDSYDSFVVERPRGLQTDRFDLIFPIAREEK